MISSYRSKDNLDVFSISFFNSFPESLHCPDYLNPMGSLGQARDELPSIIPLMTLPLFQPKYGATREEIFRLSYQKAAVINQHYGMRSVSAPE